MVILSNNLRAFGLHFLVGVLIFAIVMILGNIHILHLRNAFVLIILLFIPLLYIWLGKLFLRKQESKLKNLLSVSFTALIGLVITVIIIPVHGTSFLSLYFCDFAAVFVIIPSPTEIHINTLVVYWIFFILMSIIPSTFMWIGIETKGNY